LTISPLVVLPRAAEWVSVLTGRWGLLLVGDDWAEDHHDVELVDEAGRRLAKARLGEGSKGSPGCTGWSRRTWRRMPNPGRS
jgi:hypothetical protein